MSSYWKYELANAAHTLVYELFDVQEGETFVITADTESDPQVVDATAQAVFARGGKPMVIWLATPLGVSLAADPMLPVAALSAALREADCWVEFNKKWLLYSTPYYTAMRENPRLRYMCLTGVDVNTLVGCIGRVNYPLLGQLLEQVQAIVAGARHVHMTNGLGQDVAFENVPGRPVTCETGYARTPGIHMIAGQIGWTPELSSINGRVVLDGSVAPAVGVVREPVILEISAGQVCRVVGGKEAAAMDAWMKSFNHPQMLKIAHTGFGFLPGARLCGDILQDQRVWGSTTWGIGNIGASLLPPDGVDGPSHSDSVSLNTTVYFDGEMVLREGSFVPPELLRLQKELFKA